MLAHRIGFRRNDRGGKDAVQSRRQHLGWHHRRLHQLAALGRPDAGAAVVIELAAVDRIALYAAAGGADHPQTVEGAHVLHAGHGGVIALRLSRWRAGHHPIRHRMPADDLGTAQGGQPVVLPVGVVVANDQGNAADRGVKHADIGVARAEQLHVLAIEAVFAIFADDPFRPQQHRCVVKDPRVGIFLSNADAHVHTGAFEHRQQGIGGPTRNGVHEGSQLGGIGEVVAADRRFRKHGVLHSLGRNALGRLHEAANVAVQVTPGRDEIHGCHLHQPAAQLGSLHLGRCRQHHPTAQQAG